MHPKGATPQTKLKTKMVRTWLSFIARGASLIPFVGPFIALLAGGGAFAAHMAIHRDEKRKNHEHKKHHKEQEAQAAQAEQKKEEEERNKRPGSHTGRADFRNKEVATAITATGIALRVAGGIWYTVAKGAALVGASIVSVVGSGLAAVGAIGFGFTYMWQRFKARKQIAHDKEQEKLHPERPKRCKANTSNWWRAAAVVLGLAAVVASFFITPLGVAALGLAVKGAAVIAAKVALGVCAVGSAGALTKYYRDTSTKARKYKEWEQSQPEAKVATEKNVTPSAEEVCAQQGKNNKKEKSTKSDHAKPKSRKESKQARTEKSAHRHRQRHRQHPHRHERYTRVRREYRYTAPSAGFGPVPMQPAPQCINYTVPPPLPEAAPVSRPQRHQPHFSPVLAAPAQVQSAHLAQAPNYTLVMANVKLRRQSSSETLPRTPGSGKNERRNSTGGVHRISF